MPENQKEPRILVCDDEEGVRESLRLILSDDYDLTFARHGAEALEQVSQKDYDLILLDIKMPRIHGLEVIKQIKKIRPQTPVIIVSGYQSTEIATEALKLGADDYVPKPFESSQILTAVQNALSRS